MSSERWRGRGIVWVLAAIISMFLAISFYGVGIAKTNTESARMAKNFTEVSKNNYKCTGTVQQTADKIAADKTPLARQFDAATGTEYLRYKKEIITVSLDSTGTCVVKVEDLRRFDNGSLIFLGPGFSPSSPRNSSGGSSGSGSRSGSGSSGGGSSSVK